MLGGPRPLIRWFALTVLVLASILLALACGGRSAESPDLSTGKNDGSEARSLEVMSANIYLGGKKDRPGLHSALHRQRRRSLPPGSDIV